ncbi:hypothetical protein HYH03_005177 [Edaphochlamys debaryana]|uniref:Ion transport domain-containing protein n=1 Tax=Edaphochlamys debaryana TaxID=47281 RepID=A0A835Y7Y3_9CHLO|nr:hypothetical protein HYH03_005177 [Edaphochlamys debaryana]|eukprot:KAG2496769.1 hypothetical protein HYH03_005177 [Edaphochlamys debaryana]
MLAGIGGVGRQADTGEKDWQAGKHKERVAAQLRAAQQQAQDLLNKNRAGADASSSSSPVRQGPNLDQLVTDTQNGELDTGVSPHGGGRPPGALASPIIASPSTDLAPPDSQRRDPAAPDTPTCGGPSASEGPSRSARALNSQVSNGDGTRAGESGDSDHSRSGSGRAHSVAFANSRATSGAPSGATDSHGAASAMWKRSGSVAVAKLRTQSIASVVTLASVKQQLADQAAGISKLTPSTLYWLAVDKYGNPLPPDQAAEGQEPPLEGEDERQRLSSDGVADAAAAKQPGMKSLINHQRRRLWLLMTDAESSTAAYAVSMMVMLAILVSTVCFCLETIPAYSEERGPEVHHAFAIVETVTVQIFTADYLLRLVSCPDVLRFVVSPLNIIDLVSVVPWYVELALAGSGLQGTAVFRVLRLLRVFRVLKLGARYRKLLVVTSALSKSWDMLALMAFFVSLIVVVAATLLYFAERGEYDEYLGYHVRPNEKLTMTLENGTSVPIVSPFESIPSGFWWAIVTLMTVGYGDVTPITLGGRFVAACCMLLGILAIALPVAVIGTNFSSEWEAVTKRSGARPAGPDGVASLAPSPHLEDLMNLVDEHGHNMADIEEILEEAVAKLADLQAEVTERGQLRVAEAEALIEQHRQHRRITDKQADAVRAVVECLLQLGQDVSLLAAMEAIAANAALPPAVSNTGYLAAGAKAGGPVAEAREGALGSVPEGQVGAEADSDASMHDPAALRQPSRVGFRLPSGQEAVPGGESLPREGAPAPAAAAGMSAGAARLATVASLARLSTHDMQRLGTRAHRPYPGGPGAGSVASSAAAAMAAAAAGAAGPGGGAAGAAGGGPVWQLDPVLPPPRDSTGIKMREALDQLLGSSLHARMIDEVYEALAMQEALQRQWTLLMQVLQTCALLSGGDLPGACEALRGQYRQLAQLGKEAAELGERLDAVGERLEEVEEELERSGVEVYRGDGPRGMKALKKGAQSTKRIAAAAGGAFASVATKAAANASAAAAAAAKATGGNRRSATVAPEPAPAPAPTATLAGAVPNGSVFAGAWTAPPTVTVDGGVTNGSAANGGLAEPDQPDGPARDPGGAARATADLLRSPSGAASGRPPPLPQKRPSLLPPIPISRGSSQNALPVPETGGALPGGGASRPASAAPRSRPVSAAPRSRSASRTTSLSTTRPTAQPDALPSTPDASSSAPSAAAALQQPGGVGADSQRVRAGVTTPGSPPDSPPASAAAGRANASSALPMVSGDDAEAARKLE